MYKRSIGLHEPNITGQEWKVVKSCINSTWISSASKYVDQFEKKISQYTKSKYAIAINNCTSSLHLSLKLAGVSVGDEVIVPTVTFVAPINAVLYNQANPVFMDIDNIALDKILYRAELNQIAGAL